MKRGALTHGKRTLKGKRLLLWQRAGRAVMALSPPGAKLVDLHPKADALYEKGEQAIAEAERAAVAEEAHRALVEAANPSPAVRGQGLTWRDENVYSTLGRHPSFVGNRRRHAR